MALLMFTAADSSGEVLAEVPVVAWTVDRDLRPVTAYTGEGKAKAVVREVRTLSDAAGAVSLELVATEDLSPAGVYWAVQVAGRPPVLVDMPSGGGNLWEVLEDEPGPYYPARIAEVRAELDVVEEELDVVAAEVAARELRITSPQWRDTLRGWSAAVAGDGLARIVAFGSSTWQGEVDVLRVGVAVRVEDLLSSRLNASGLGGVWTPVRRGQVSLVAWSGTPTGGSLVNDRGLGGWSWLLGAGDSVDHTPWTSSDGFSVLYGTTPGGGTLEVRIDGTLVAELETDDDEADGLLWTSDALDLGEHTIEATAADGPVRLEGCYTHRTNRAAGVQLWNASHSGWSTRDFLDRPEAGLDHLDHLDPALVLITTGQNDHAAGAATWAERLEEFVDEVRSRAPLASIGLVFAADTGARANWPGPFRQVARSVSSSLGLHLIDLYEVLGTATTGAGNDPLGIMADAVHANEKGHRWMADAVAGSLAGQFVERAPLLRVDGSRPMRGTLSAPAVEAVEVAAGELSASEATIGDLVVTGRGRRVWVSVSGPQVANTTSETSLLSDPIDVAAGQLQPGDRLSVVILFHQRGVSGTPATATFRAKFAGGALLVSQTVMPSLTGNNRPYRFELEILGAAEEMVLEARWAGWSALTGEPLAGTQYQNRPILPFPPETPFDMDFTVQLSAASPDVAAKVDRIYVTHDTAS